MAHNCRPSPPKCLANSKSVCGSSSGMAGPTTPETLPLSTPLPPGIYQMILYLTQESEPANLADMKELKELLTLIVTDLEKSASGLAALRADVRKLSPKSLADEADAIGLAAKANQDFYNQLRTRIDVLL